MMRSTILLAITLSGYVSSTLGFATTKWCPMTRCSSCKPSLTSRSAASLLNLSPEDTTLAVWVAAFSASHIGMSASRNAIIDALGNAIASMNLVGRDEWRLPSYWPGDSSPGSDRIFPNPPTAGRQTYRAGYTAVSFFTLGSAFAAYLDSATVSSASLPTSDAYNFYLAAAAISIGASLASLFNASPLGLMPGFEAASAESSTPILQRDDTLKFDVRGLTRITRHPLILPVVAWGIATAHLAGGRPCDFILFCGLSAYAIAGCAAQDLRVSKREGSVGTVFATDDEGELLTQFFESTSFVPFGAVLDGRQSITDIVREFPWIPFLVGIGVGVWLEETILSLLQEWTQ